MSTESEVADNNVPIKDNVVINNHTYWPILLLLLLLLLITLYFFCKRKRSNEPSSSSSSSSDEKAPLQVVVGGTEKVSWNVIERWTKENPQAVVGTLFKIRGEKFPKLDNILAGGRVDSYFKVIRVVDGKRVEVYNSEFIERDVTPVFAKCIIIDGLSNSIENTEKLEFEWWDKNKIKDDEFFGKMTVSRADMITNGPLHKYSMEGEKTQDVVVFIETAAYNHSD